MKKMVRFLALVCLLPPPLLAAPADAPPLARETSDGFAVPQPGYAFVFPDEHGSHPDFRIEWWYLTGHLFGEDGRRFGFQATFFRSALGKPGRGDGVEAFGSRQLYLAHCSLLDADQKRFIHEERLNRDGWDASAATGHLDVKNGNWSLRMTDAASETMQLEASVHGEAGFSLRLVPSKRPVIFGSNGVSRKGADATAASYYITFTRLEVSGQVSIAGAPVSVTGEAWMDHEISSSQLAEGQRGWDWCSLQFDDGWELMAYRLRRDDGTTDPFSTLAWVSPEGRVTHLNADEFRWEPLAIWKSPQTGGEYPVRYRLHTRSADRAREVTLEIRPVFDAQELTGEAGGIAYWEGAGDVFDASGARIGRGYTELTGYAESLYGRF